MATSAVATSKAPAKAQSPALPQWVQKPLQEDTVPSVPRHRHISFRFKREVPAWKLKVEPGTALLNQSKPEGVPLL